jgi:hypothetical protein
VTGRPALRVALLGLGAAVVAAGLVAGTAVVRLRAYDAARDRATEIVSGEVVQDGIGDNGDIRVRWSDARHTHLQRFEIYDTDVYTEGRTFRVAYDPKDPTPRGFPADPEETAQQDDLVFPAVIVAGLAGVVLLVWVARWLAFVVTARRPAVGVVTEVCVGEPVQARSGLAARTTSWLRVPGPEAGASRFQRVMWHPSLDLLVGPTWLEVRGLGRRGRVVAVLPDGARPVPVGRLRNRPPKTYRLTPALVARSSLRDLFVVPASGAPAARWWYPAAVLAAAGALVGAALGLLVGAGPIDALLFVPGGAALAANLWALVSPDP